MFEAYTAAQYRALDDAAFETRKSYIVDLMSGVEELPEEVTDEMLFAEADLIEVDTNRRNKAAALRDQTVAKVVASAKTVETNANESKQERGFKAVSEGRYVESSEYRSALAKLCYL